MMKKQSIVAFLLLIAFTVCAQAQTDDTAEFERRVVMCKELGATHMSITDDLPPSVWQFDAPDDPYPAWFIYRPGLLKIFPPKEVEPFVNMEHAAKVIAILEKRCEILKKHEMKGHWNSNEPQVLPEAFFTAYPALRGPRVDQPNRSRVARFSPCVNEPETLRLYADAMKSLVQRFPQIDSFGFLTQDSGSGFCWAPSLYPGINGNSNCKNRPIEQRVAGFLINLQNAAKEAGSDITININPISPRQWMIPTFSPAELNALIARLPRGLAVQGREGPDGRPFNVPSGGTGTGRIRNEFDPVVGIVVPSMSGSRGGRGGGGPDSARRIIINLGDPTTQDFTYRLLKTTQNAPSATTLQRLQSLRAFAVSEVGEANADDLMAAWESLERATQNLNALNFGSMLRFGHVLNRWVARPMVPFPKELKPWENDAYRRFLFQAKGQEQATNLIDIQAMRMFEGWGAKMLFQRVIETTVPQVRSAMQRIERIRDSASGDVNREYWNLTAKRLDALICLLESADHMVSYQAELDRVHELDLKPEENPPLGVQSDWQRTDMMELARKEIDNMVHLRELILSTPEPILDTAQTADEETIMRLGPDIADQIKTKIDTMNAHWRDYDRIFTKPNP